MRIMKIKEKEKIVSTSSLEDERCKYFLLRCELIGMEMRVGKIFRLDPLSAFSSGLIALVAAKLFLSRSDQMPYI